MILLSILVITVISFISYCYLDNFGKDFFIYDNLKERKLGWVLICKFITENIINIFIIELIQIKLYEWEYMTIVLDVYKPVKDVKIHEC